MTHSPSPWKREEMRIVDADGKSIATIGFTHPKSGSMLWPQRDEAEHNMVFFLAMPELLAAAKEMVEHNSASKRLLAAVKIASGG